MPSFDVHIAVAKKYIEKHDDIIDEKQFYIGNIIPDLTDNKKKTHYSGIQDKTNCISYLSNKVDLKKYLEQEDITTDYQKGIFLHLITDYIFFTSFFDKDYLMEVNLDSLKKDLYYSYKMVVNSYIRNMYGVDYDIDLPENFSNIIKKHIKKSHSILEQSQFMNIIIDTKKLDLFIDYVSSIDIDEIKKSILKGKQISLTK